MSFLSRLHVTSLCPCTLLMIVATRDEVADYSFLFPLIHISHSTMRRWFEGHAHLLLVIATLEAFNAVGVSHWPLMAVYTLTGVILPSRTGSVQHFYVNNGRTVRVLWS